MGEGPARLLSCSRTAAVGVSLLLAAGPALGAETWLSCPVQNAAFRVLVFDDSARTFQRYQSGALYPCNAATIDARNIVALCGIMNVSIDRQTGAMVIWSNEAARRNVDDSQHASCSRIQPQPLGQRKF